MHRASVLEEPHRNAVWRETTEMAIEWLPLTGPGSALGQANIVILLSFGNGQPEGTVLKGSNREQGSNLQTTLRAEAPISHSDQLCCNENRRR